MGGHVFARDKFFGDRLRGVDSVGVENCPFPLTKAVVLYRYVCEQLPGAYSRPIVTKLDRSYPWPQGTR